jgi:magnesium transporter
MLKNYSIENNKVVETKSSESSVMLFVNPDNSERKILIEKFDIDEHTVNSALDPEEPSRLEVENDVLMLIFKRPKNYSAEDKFLFKVNSMGLFLFKDKLVVVMSEDVPMFTGKTFLKVRSIDDVFLKLINNSITHFLEHLRIINMTTDEIERKITRSMENKYLISLFSLEKSLVYYINAINSNWFALEKVKNYSKKHSKDEPFMEMLDDLIVENKQCLRQAEIYSNILASLMDARVSIVSNNLNIFIKTLTLITIALMIPTLVVSIFSMNVPIPFQHHPSTFYWVLAASWGLVGLSFWYAKVKKW